jgi:hypothetical protein
VSGVFLRFPRPRASADGNPAFGAIYHGLKVQLDEMGPPGGTAIHRTGAFFGERSQVLRPPVVRPPAEWNALEIAVRGQHYEVRLNGELTSDAGVLGNMLSGTAAAAARPGTLPSNTSYDGKIKNTTVALTLASNPMRGLDSRAYYNYYDKDNQSSQVTFNNCGVSTGLPATFTTRTASTLTSNMSSTAALISGFDASRRTLNTTLFGISLALGHFPVGFSALLVGLGSQTRQILLQCLQARLALGQALGSHTILSNQSSVHRGQGREMSELDRLADGIVAGEEKGQRSALDLELVERAEPPLEHVLLTEPLAAKLADVHLETADIRLGLLDPAVQRHDLLALVRDPPVDGFELGQ